jgi:hypothetical protein
VREAIGLVLALFLAGCASLRLGWTVARLQGQVLSLSSARGMEAFEIQHDVDPAIRGYYQRYGLPDYILVEDEITTRLIYVDEDRVIRFQRSMSSRAGTPAETDGIPDDLIRQLSASDQQRIRERRARPGV